LGSWSWPSLAAAIGRFDADIEVVGPTELKDAFALLARRYADAVAGGPTKPHPATFEYLTGAHFDRGFRP